MVQPPISWPNGTGELLPNLLYKIAAQYPDLIWTEYSINPNDARDGYRKVTFREFANAVHAMAWWIEENVGKPKTNDGSETLVYMGPNEVIFAILALGSSMAGYKTLFPRPRHSVEGTAVLIDSVDGKVLLTPNTPFPFSSEVLERRPMATMQLPSAEHFMSSQPSPYPYTKTFEQNKHEPFIVLHTSGTTGFPKPIIWTHEWPSSFSQSLYLSCPEGYEPLDQATVQLQSRALMFFPAFHSSGFHGTLLYPLYAGTIAIWPPSGPDPIDKLINVIEALDVIGGPIASASVPPPYVDFLGTHPDILSRLASKVGGILFAGGDVNQAAGETVAATMPLVDRIGSTELGVWPDLKRKGPRKAGIDDYWHYCHFNPGLNLRFEHVSDGVNGGIYEAFIVKNKGEGAWVQPIFTLFPGQDEISLHDLFTPHPQSSHHWKHYGRTDELLTFITGEKWHPGGTEKKLGEHPGIAEAMMVGTRRATGSMIVRLEAGYSVYDVWSVIEEVNKVSPVYARVNSRDMILVVKEPFLKTPKGSIQKNAMLKLYEKDLDRLYEATQSKNVQP